MFLGVICVLLSILATYSAGDVIRINNTDDSGTYPIEFTTVCSSDYVTLDGARNLCTGEGAEWYLGMTPTENISRKVNTELINETTWVDATNAYYQGSSYVQWKTTPRRDTEIRFVKIGTERCLDNVYCNMSKFPEKSYEYKCGGYSRYLVILADGSWRNRNEYGKREGEDCFPAKCALCQRFPCDVATDCIASNTINVTGYAPNCQCLCKDSFGNRCQYVSADYGNFNTTYSAGCDNSPLQYTAAVSKCEALGDGWSLSSLPTNASAAVRSKLLPNDTTWMAAKYDGVSWKWAAGRFDGHPMNGTYAPWKDGSPSTATNERAAFSSVDATWIDSATVDSSSFPSCYICEKSPCNVTTDCNPDGADSVSGYYGNCVCKCKEQWGGKRCELFTTIYTETFSTEYDVVCYTSSYSYYSSYVSRSGYYNGADKLCTKKGTGWALASPATELASTLLTELVRAKGEQAWISGEKRGNQWVWTKGRLKDQAFASSNGQCYASSYCHWASNAPIEGSCRSNSWSNDGDPKYVVLNKEGNWSNTEESFSSYSSDKSKCPGTKCSACERSPCNITADCYAGGTINMTGSYYPDCVCTCRPGYNGSRCETLTFSAVNGPATEASKQYTSDYRLSCTSNPLTYIDAEAACHQHGSKWLLGTLPSAAATEALRATNATNVSIWLAAGYVPESGWQWLGGRLKGKPLSLYTNWGDGAPHNNTTSTCGTTTSRTALAVDGEGNWTDIYNDTSCNTLPSCYLCERPGCVLEEDCLSEHTESVSGYYGACVCVCKEGWTGPRCEKESILVREKYVMEYYVGCDDAQYISFRTANSHCTARGNGWTIAASPDEEVNNNLLSLIRENAWIAGKEKSVATKWKWVWAAGDYNGRYKDQVFASSKKCTGWCKFPSGKPEEKRTCGGYNDNLILNPQGEWLEQNELPRPASKSSTEPCHLARCYLCERSRCNITGDCFTRGTESVSGWYPTCHCVCKPGFTGEKCDRFSFVSTAAPLTFEYEGICDANNNPVHYSAVKCSSGYTIASFAPANASTDYIAVVSQSGIVAWIGAERVDGSFQWTAGRFSGQTVNASTTQYYSGRPSPGKCLDTQSKYLSITSEGVMYDSYDNNQCDAVLATPNANCYICERSPCVLEMDCNATNTLRVSGYYGNCRCYCNSEYGGPRCDDYNIVNSTTYVTQYTVGCGMTYVSYAEAQTACGELGDGWMIAAVPSAEVNSNIQKFIPDGERAWLRGFFSWSTRKWSWSGKSTYGNTNSYVGRTKVDFANSTSCFSDIWCNFTEGTLSNPTYKKCPHFSYQTFVAMNSNGTWQQVTEDATTTTDGCYPSRCYACERSPCSAMEDCFARGTANVTGYYPNCMCLCKANFTGEKCDTAVHHGAAYGSEYKLSCSKQAILYTSARGVCKLIGDEWDIATVPTSAAAETVLTLLNEDQTAWLGGTDQLIEGEWRWKAGRHNEKLFYNGTPVEGYYTAWGTGWPRNESCDDGMTSDYLVVLGNATWVHTYYKAFENCPLTQPLPSCTVCERQPCDVVLDCDADNTLSVEGNYPNCQCSCKEGWGGARCNIASTVYNNVDGSGYFSEYTVKCHGSSISHDDAVKRCTALGDGWTIASVPSDEANNVISSMANERIWLGAWEIGRMFRWNAETRAKNYLFTENANKRSRYKCKDDAYCRISGIINTNTKDNCRSYSEKLAMDPDKTWKGYSKSKLYGTCDLLARCYACERSRCNITLDCVGEHTERVSGYYPSCTCHCKFGYYGLKCDKDGFVADSNESDPNTYATMYRFECTNSYWGITYKKALDTCSGYGDSWQLATIGGFAALTKIQENAASGTYWLAGADTHDDGYHGWKWQTGRLKGKWFYGGPDDSCQQACGFSGDQPEESDAFAESCYRKLATQGASWSALLPDSICPSASSFLPKCYVCERSQCKYITDCNITHTYNVTGYYPNCMCSCHAGWGGPRCSQRVCHIDTDCAGLATNVTGEYPQCQCIGCPNGHRQRDCATLTSSTTLSSTSTIVLKTETASATDVDEVLQTLSKTFSVAKTTEANDTTTANETTDNNMTSTPTEVTNTTETTESSANTTETTTDTSETTNLTEVTDAPNETTLTTQMTTCQFKFNFSCARNSVYEHYEPLPPIRVILEIDALASARSVSLLLPVALTQNGDMPLTAYTYMGWSPNNRSQQLNVSGVAMKQDGLALTIMALENAIMSTEISVFAEGCCDNATTENTIRMATVKLVVSDLETKNKTIGVVNESLQLEFGNSAEKSMNNLRQEQSWLLGAPEDSQVLRAFSPFALLVGGPDGYVSLLLSNLIIIIVVTVIHFIAVMVHRVRTHLPLAEVCPILAFPSLSLYVIYALLPGIALAAGGLTRVGSPLGIVGLLFTLCVIITSGLYPYLYLSRGLYSVPLLPDKPETKKPIMFPTTILAPSEIASAYAALVKNYRYPLALWTTLPTWSSLLILVASLMSPSAGIYFTVGAVHCIIILFVIMMSPHSCFALDVMYCLGILPVGALAIVRGIQLNKGPGSLEGASNTLLIIITIVTALRLVAALFSPFKIITLTSYENITHEVPLWVFNSKCGREFQGLNDLEVAMFSFKETSDIAGEGVLFPDNGSSVSGASGQPGHVLQPKVDSSSSVASGMPVAVENAATHSVKSSGKKEEPREEDKGKDSHSSISGAPAVNPPEEEDPFN